MQRLDDMLAPERNFMQLDAYDADFERARVVVVPVPFDGTTCYRPGTREGPQAIIDASRNLELYDAELRRAPYRLGIHTLRAVEIVNGDAAAMVERVDRVTDHLIEAGKWVLTLGGDHLVAIGAIQAHARHYPALSVLQLDAHADLRDEYEGARYSAATVMRRTLEVCPSIAQVGIRSLSEPEAELVEERELPQFLAAEIHAERLAGRRDWTRCAMRSTSRSTSTALTRRWCQGPAPRSPADWGGTTPSRCSPKSPRASASSVRTWWSSPPCWKGT